MFRKIIKSSYSVAATEMIKNKIRMLSNTFMRGIQIRVTRVPTIGQVTLKNMNVREIELELQNGNGKLGANIQVLTIINNLQFQFQCQVGTKFKEDGAQIQVQQFKAQIKSKKDQITAMVLQNYINMHLKHYKIAIPPQFNLFRHLLKVKEDNESDIIELDYEAYKQQKEK